MQHLDTIIDRFLFYEKTKPTDLFLSEPVNGIYQSFTWSQAGNEVRRMITALHKMGFAKGDNISILGKNSAHWILADMAIMMAGFVSVPLYANNTPDAIKHVIEHSESKLVFIGKLDDYNKTKKGIPENVIKVSFPFCSKEDCIQWSDLINENEPIQNITLPNDYDLSCILYTSGTTGNPKGAMHHYYSQAFTMHTVLKELKGINSDIFFSYLPLCHVAEKMLVEAGAIYTGSSIYFVESMDTFSKNLADTQPTIFLAVPRIWEKFQEEILKKIPQKKLDTLLKIPIISSLIKKTLRKKLGLSRAKYIFTGASPIMPSLQYWYLKLGILIQEAYGMTENLALSHLNRKENAIFGSVGQSYNGVEVRLGAEDEVQVKSPASMIGYFKDPELTAQCFDDGFLKTGDKGVIDENGFLKIVGRIKDQFKTSKGKYVTPAAIESKIAVHPFISQVCVVGTGLSQPIALCILSEAAQKEIKEKIIDSLNGFIKEVNAQLEHYAQLAKVVILKEEWTVENGCLTPTLKIKRNNIEKDYSHFFTEWMTNKNNLLFVH